MKKLESLRIVVVLFGLVALVVSPIALAWDGVVTGVPAQLDAAPGSGALGFRVSLTPSAAMCGNTNNWAYLNTVDPNYSASVAIIMMAKAQGLGVTLYSTVDANGYCHIGYIAVH